MLTRLISNLPGSQNRIKRRIQGALAGFLVSSQLLMPMVSYAGKTLDSIVATGNVNIGENISVDSDHRIWLYAGPGSEKRRIELMPAGTGLEIIDDSITTIGRYNWINVRNENGNEGYVTTNLVSIIDDTHGDEEKNLNSRENVVVRPTSISAPIPTDIPNPIPTALPTSIPTAVAVNAVANSYSNASDSSEITMPAIIKGTMDNNGDGQAYSGKDTVNPLRNSVDSASIDAAIVDVFPAYNSGEFPTTIEITYNTVGAIPIQVDGLEKILSNPFPLPDEGQIGVVLQQPNGKISIYQQPSVESDILKKDAITTDNPYVIIHKTSYDSNGGLWAEVANPSEYGLTDGWIPIMYKQGGKKFPFFSFMESSGHENFLQSIIEYTKRLDITYSPTTDDFTIRFNNKESAPLMAVMVTEFGGGDLRMLEPLRKSFNNEYGTERSDQIINQLYLSAGGLIAQAVDVRAGGNSDRYKTEIYRQSQFYGMGPLAGHNYQVLSAQAKGEADGCDGKTIWISGSRLQETTSENGTTASISTEFPFSNVVFYSALAEYIVENGTPDWFDVVWGNSKYFGNFSVGTGQSNTIDTVDLTSYGNVFFPVGCHVPIGESAQSKVSIVNLSGNEVSSDNVTLNERDMPSTDGKIIGKLNPDEKSEAIGYAINGGDLWIYTKRSDGSEAWVYGKGSEGTLCRAENSLDQLIKGLTKYESEIISDVLDISPEPVPTALLDATEGTSDQTASAASGIVRGIQDEGDVKTYITLDNVVLRNNPDTESEKIITIPKGSLVSYIGDAGKSGGYSWAEIKVNGNIGYAAAQYLEEYIMMDYSNLPTLPSNATTEEINRWVVEVTGRDEFKRLLREYNDFKQETSDLGEYGAFTFIDCDTGSKISHNGDIPYHAMSTIKGPLAIFAAHVLSDETWNNNTSSIKNQVLIQSNNIQTGRLFSLVGEALGDSRGALLLYNQFLEENGCIDNFEQGTDCEGVHRWGYGGYVDQLDSKVCPAGIGSTARDANNGFTTDGLAEFYRRVADGKLTWKGEPFDADDYQKIEQVMLRNQYAGGAYVGDDNLVKHGNGDGTYPACNTAGLAMTDNGEYAIEILTYMNDGFSTARSLAQSAEAFTDFLDQFKAVYGQDEMRHIYGLLEAN